jgi:DNA polymerase elongation subunit (family B)
MLDLLRTCENRQEYENKNGQIREVMENYLMRLHTGDLKNEELLVAKSVRQNVEAYKVDNLTALALRQLAEGGIRIHPGEKIYYLIREAQAKNKEERVRVFPFLKVEDGYDEKKYRELLQEAAKEIIPNSI